MSESRVDEFKADIAEMRIKDPTTARDTLLLRIGLVVMGLGIVLTIVAYFSSHQTRDPLVQGDAHVIALIGVALTVAGSALFLRFSLASFLRFWLARLIYEQRVQTDRLLADARSEKVPSA